MAGMIPILERPQARRPGPGMLATGHARLSRLMAGAEKRHRHNQPVPSAC